MIFLYILGVLAFLIFLLLMTNVKVHVKSDGDLTLRVGAGLIMLGILPKKQKKIKLRHFSHKKYLRKMEALQKKREEKQKKKEEKQKTKEKADDKVKTKEEKKDSVMSIIELVIEILGNLEKYTSRINAKLDRLYLSVGGKDPSDVAVKFGVLSASVGLLLELLDSKTKLKVKNPDNLSVVCDYFSDDIKFFIDVTVKIRILDVVKTGIEILVLWLKHSINKKTNILSNERQVSQNGREQAE